MPQTPAFLSVRLPEATRDRLRSAAAAQGQTMQSLVGGLVDRFLAEQGTAPPALAAVLRMVRDQAARLRQQGITGLWVFGSVARGDARPGSDIDLFATLDTHVSLVGLASLRAELSDLLGTPADLVERDAMRPAVRAAAERDAVQAL